MSPTTSHPPFPFSCPPLCDDYDPPQRPPWNISFPYFVAHKLALLVPALSPYPMDPVIHNRLRGCTQFATGPSLFGVQNSMPRLPTPPVSVSRFLRVTLPKGCETHPTCLTHIRYRGAKCSALLGFDRLFTAPFSMVTCLLYSRARASGTHF